MKKVILAALVAPILFLSALAGCSKPVDFTAYISEMRTDIFIYSDDDMEIKAYCSKKEQPYVADGIMGEPCEVVEVFVSFSKPHEEVVISLGGLGGEMSYRAVDNDYYLSLSAAPFSGGMVEAELTVDGESRGYRLLSVKDDGVMSCQNAVLCVVEHDRELFDGLVENGVFKGEIYARLLYDDGCYYYVGVCDRDKNLTAFLLDGVKGKIIATKNLTL